MTLEMGALVSVVTATFNREELISRTFASIINQTYQEIEIIIIDDGSDDNTRGVVEGLIRKAARPVKYYYQKNSGCASARNLGVEKATGQLVAFLDSDDEWRREAISNLVKTIRGKNTDFVYSPAIEAFEGGRKIINYPVARNCPESLAVEHLLSTNVRNGSVLFRRKIFDDLGGLRTDLKYNEDSDFIQRVSINFKAAYCDEPTVIVNHHSNNKSKNRVEIARAVLRSTEDILAEYPEFHKANRGIIDKRVAELKLNLIETLIKAGLFAEGRAFRKLESCEMPLLLLLSLKLNAIFLLKLQKLLNRLGLQIKG